jgi:hypothetical protein
MVNKRYQAIRFEDGEARVNVVRPSFPKIK